MREPGVQVDYKSRNLSVKVIIGIAAIVVGAVFFRYEIGVLFFVIIVITGLFGLLSIVNKGFSSADAYQRYRLSKAQADEAQAKADAARYILYAGQQGIVLRYGSQVDYIPPTVSERKQLSNGIIDGEVALAPLDFFTAMLGTQQPYKIIAEQRRGKSYLGMHITDRAKSRGETCIVVGTKHEPGEWPNAYRYLIKAELVQAGLLNLINETNKRNEIFQRSPLLRVFLDDWINTAICYPALAQEFLELAATKMLTAGIVPYFLLQGDGNDDWGNKKSAMLKNNFTGLWVSGPRDEQGDPIPQLNTAVLRYPGSREELPVRLPAGFPKLGLGQLPAPGVPPPEPNEEERQVLEMVASGASLRQITTEIWGQYGQHYNERVDRIVRKYGHEIF